MTAKQPLRIDFVSDVACPWCAIGLNALERALERIGDDVPVQIHMQPFELNPTLSAEGANAAQYLKGKYGMSDEQLAINRARIAERGAAEGFTFGAREHVWNTFDAHRLLYWAGLQNAQAQHALKRALLETYHGHGRSPENHDVLLDAALQAGLDREEASRVLGEGRFADEVREREQFYQEHGIHAVPAVIIDDRHLISGGQPPEVFEQALRQLAGAS
jgi:predicted DsbA family dithiol-disulfide isomerase